MDDRSQLRNGFLGLHALGDVGNQAHPFVGLAGCVSKRHAPIRTKVDLVVFSENPVFAMVPLSVFDLAAESRYHPFEIIRMNHALECFNVLRYTPASEPIRLHTVGCHLAGVQVPFVNNIAGVLRGDPEPLLGGAQIFLSLLALGDVFHQHDHARRLTLVLCNGHAVANPNQSVALPL